MPTTSASSASAFAVLRGLVLLLLLQRASPFQAPSSSTAWPSRASSSPLFRRRAASASVAEASASASVADALASASSVAASPSRLGASSAALEDPGESVVGVDAEAEEDGVGGAQLGAWIPVGSASALTGLGPQRVRVMGIDLVVWHKPLDEDDPSSSSSGKLGGRLGKLFGRKKKAKQTAATEWSVQHDSCPHRLAPLSQGRVDPTTGCIECPYHGWQFSADGKLTSLPQIEEGRSIDSVAQRGGNVRTLPVHLAGDLIFAFLPTSAHGESFPRFLLPEEQYPYLADEAAKGKRYFVRELPYSADFVIENFMDPAHVPFAHHSLQSVREDGSPVNMRVVESNFTHVEVAFSDKSRGKERDGIASFQRPSLYHFRTRDPSSGHDEEYRPNLQIYITPVDAGRTRVLFAGIDFWWCPTWLSHAGSNRFLNTDTWLHDAERAARSNGDAAEPGYVYGSRSDLGVSAFRRWWSANGFRDAPRHTFGPSDPSDLGPRALTRREQIDPWEHHSRHCSECRAALRTMKRGQIAGLAAAAMSAVFLRGRPALAAAAIGAGIWTHVFLKKCATVIEGNPYPSGVSDRSAAHVAE